jgi:hypothetical protein
LLRGPYNQQAKLEIPSGSSLISGSFGLGPGFVAGDFAIAPFVAVHGRNGFIRVGVFHVNKTKASGLAAELVGHDSGRYNITELSELRFQVSIGNGPGQIAHKDTFHVYILLFLDFSAINGM